MPTTTNLDILKINYLTLTQYQDAVENDEINENELYCIPGSPFIDMFYPVGSYYETSDVTFNPNTAWGGTWVLETEGQVHISAGTNYVVNGAPTDTNDGGSPYIQAHTHTYTNPTVPNHTHSIAAQGTIQTWKATNSSGTGSKDLIWHSSSGTSVKLTLPAHNTNSSGTCTTTGGAVGAVSGATTGTAGNMPPYIIVNRWHRMA